METREQSLAKKQERLWWRTVGKLATMKTTSTLVRQVPKEELQARETAQLAPLAPETPVAVWAAWKGDQPGQHRLVEQCHVAAG